MVWVVVLCALIALLWAVARFKLQGKDLSEFDQPRDPPVGTRTEPSPEHYQVVASLANVFGAPGAGPIPRPPPMAVLRKRMDELGDAADMNDIRIVPPAANGVPAEWVLAPGIAPDRRLLYVHGGAFTVGSP